MDGCSSCQISNPTIANIHNYFLPYLESIANRTFDFLKICAPNTNKQSYLFMKQSLLCGKSLRTRIKKKASFAGGLG